MAICKYCYNSKDFTSVIFSLLQDQISLRLKILDVQDF